MREREREREDMVRGGVQILGTLLTKEGLLTIVCTPSAVLLPSTFSRPQLPEARTTIRETARALLVSRANRASCQFGSRASRTIYTNAQIQSSASSVGSVCLCAILAPRRSPHNPFPALPCSTSLTRLPCARCFSRAQPVAKRRFTCHPRLSFISPQNALLSSALSRCHASPLCHWTRRLA